MDTNQVLLFMNPDIIRTDDAKCYTIKQIDDLLASSGMSGFALETERNCLIDRLKTRLAIRNKCDGNISGNKKIDVLIGAGFFNYEKLIYLIDRDRTPVFPPNTLASGFKDMAAALLDMLEGVSGAKFVFSDESMEFKFRDSNSIGFSFEIFYDSVETVFVSAEVPLNPFDASSGFRLYADDISTNDIDAAMEYIDKVHMVYMHTYFFHETLNELKEAFPYLK